jgi:predicted transglutaminase-like cysteine proteinase
LLTAALALSPAARASDAAATAAQTAALSAAVLSARGLAAQYPPPAADGVPRDIFVSRRYRIRYDASYPFPTSQWLEVVEKHRQDLASGRLALKGDGAVDEWNFLTKRVAQDRADCRKDDSRCLRGVVDDINRIVNKKIRYISDNEHYRRDPKRCPEYARQFGNCDYWAPPLETLGDHKGDCEDYAILKYFLLKDLFPEGDMFMTLVMVHYGSGSGYHMVLAAKIGGSLVILDNMNDSLADFNDTDYDISSGMTEHSTVTVTTRDD